jgi:hypothetical protein
MHSPQLGKVGKYKRGKLCIIGLFVCLMVFSAIFNKLHVIKNRIGGAMVSVLASSEAQVN